MRMFTVSELIHHAVSKISRDGLGNLSAMAEMASFFLLYADGCGLVYNFITVLFKLDRTQYRITWTEILTACFVDYSLSCCRRFSHSSW